MRIVPDREPRFFAPTFWLSLGLAAGFFPLFLPWWLRLGLALSLATSAGALLIRFRLGPGRRLFAWLLLSFALGILLGLLLQLREAGLPPIGQSFPEAQIPVQGQMRRLAVTGVAGTLATDSTPARGGQRLMRLDATRLFLGAPGISGWTQARGRLALLVRDGPALAAGSEIEVRGELALGTDRSLMFADRRSLIVRREGGALSLFRNRLREAFLSSLTLGVRGWNPKPDPSAERETGLLLALLAGYRDSLSPEDEAAFRGAGCTHILALSGQHLSLIAAALALILKPLMGPRRSLLVSLFATSLYVVVVGPGPSLLRSLIAYAIGATALLFDRPQTGRSILGLTFLLHAILLPGDLREAGFVLSYLAVTGLVLLSPRFEHLLSPWLPPAIAGAFATAMAAQTATSPWIALFFGIFQPVGIIATIMTALLVEGIMVFGLASALVCSICAPFSVLSAPLSQFLLRLLSDTMVYFSRLPSLALPDETGRLLLSFAVAGLALFIYARPYVEYRAWQGRSPPGAVARSRPP